MRRKSINTGIGKINILICGLPGSGKITLPKKITRTVRLCLV